MSHPPWLRFQAYVLGLPKTGSTSLATIFGSYRTGHEAGIEDLLRAGLPWRNGQIDEATFWEFTTPRLTRPALEMDSATCHHLYAELLVQRYPNARFIHSVRDVGGWLSSLLDFTLRFWFARKTVGIPATDADTEFIGQMTGFVMDDQWSPHERDDQALVPMMRYWAEHMRHIGQVMPADRGLVVRTRDIGQRLPELAGLVGVPVQSLRADLAHANRAPRTLDRLALYSDRSEIRAAYDEYCADIMAQLFPQEHARAFDQVGVVPDWQEHCDAVSAWVEQTIGEYRERTGEPALQWVNRRPHSAEAGG